MTVRAILPFLLIAFAAFAVAAPPTSAALITFEGASGFADDIGEFIDVDGFRFTFSAGNSNGFEVITNQDNIIEGDTTKLFAANRAEITMTMIGGGAFNLLSLDVGGSFITSPTRWASSVDVTDGSNTVNVPLPSGDPTYQSVSPGFFNVTSVMFIPFINAGGGPNNFEFTLDNIQVSVPEPSALLLLSLGALVVLRRRQRRA